jgi:hypothetical protein
MSIEFSAKYKIFDIDTQYTRDLKMIVAGMDDCRWERCARAMVLMKIAQSRRCEEE